MWAKLLYLIAFYTILLIPKNAKLQALISNGGTYPKNPIFALTFGTLAVRK
jgi:hypothetical protein